MVKNNVVIVTQARIGSSRFPEKVLKPLGTATLLGVHLERLKKVKNADTIIVATTFEEKSSQIIAIANELGVNVFQGSENDVLDRFYQAVKGHQPKFVVRVTSDCPLIDPKLVEEIIQMVIDQDLDYGSNVLIEAFPDGQDAEVFKFEALEKAWKEAKLNSEREHVTPFIRNNSDYKGGTLFKANNFNSSQNFNHIRMTVDEPSDLETIQILIDKLGTDENWMTYTQFIIENINLFKNQDTTRNEGYLKSIKEDSHEQ